MKTLGHLTDLRNVLSIRKTMWDCLRALFCRLTLPPPANQANQLLAIPFVWNYNKIWINVSIRQPVSKTAWFDDLVYLFLFKIEGEHLKRKKWIWKADASFVTILAGNWNNFLISFCRLKKWNKISQKATSFCLEQNGQLRNVVHWIWVVFAFVYDRTCRLL